MESALTHDIKQIRGPYDWEALRSLIQREFAYMQGRIDPPSSMHDLTPEAIAEQARSGEIWAIEHAPGRPIATVFLTPQPPALYLHKLTVASTHRGKGHARRLVARAAARAEDLGLTELSLKSRVELFENHAAFTALGFAITGLMSHTGFTRPTSVTMQRPVGG